jgi:predicted RNA-binding Zn ribbon-like protein
VVTDVTEVDDFPEDLRIVRSFANSVDVASAEDDLESPERFGRWLVAHGFDHPHPTRAELHLAIALRDALRAELMAHHGADDRPDASRLDEWAARVPLRVSFTGGAPELVPAAGGVHAMLGRVLARWVLGEKDDSWHRLKLCRADDCQVTFYDRSKNQSKAWCSMGACGNRNKTRTYRDRQKATDRA